MKQQVINMYSLSKTIFILLLMVLFAGRSYPQLNPSLSCFFVDKNHPLASNMNPGTSNLPWLTIQHALDVAQAGDSIVVRNGIYYESLTTQRDGDFIEGHIVLSGYPGDEVVIDGSGNSSHSGIRIYNSWIKLRALEVRNWENAGIWVASSGYFEIHHCEVHQMRFGIGITAGSHDFLLFQNDIHHFDYYGVDISPMGTDYCYNGRIIECRSHTCRDPLQNVDGFALGHGAQNTFLFQDCHAYDVFDGFDISSASTTLKNCKSDHCANACYKLWATKVVLENCIGYMGNISVVQLGWIGVPTKTTIRNCTFFDAEVYTIWQANSNDTLELYNTIIAGGDNIGLCFENPSAVNYYGNNNLFQNNNPDRAINVGWSVMFSISEIQSGIWTAYGGQDGQSVTANLPPEIFVDADQPDLHPKQDGPAIDQGDPAWSTADDFNGFLRPIGDYPDIGAYESQLAIWNGSVSEDWAVGDNWEGNLSPLATSNVLISEAERDAVLSGEAVVANLSIDPGGKLIIDTQGSLEVSGSVVNRFGVNGFLLKSNSFGTGALIHHTQDVPATVERFIQAADWNSWDDGWHNISSPVSGQAIFPEFVTGYTSGGEDFYKWSEPENIWINIKDASGTGWTSGFEQAFETGKGYLIASQSSQTKLFSGVLNVSDVALEGLTYTEATGKHHGWNLIGNPYSCGLEWFTDWETENIGGVACIWNEASKSYSPLNAGDVIPQGNGFMVSVSQTTGGSLTIPTGKRVLSGDNWLKTTHYPVIRLYAINTGNQSKQESQIRFHPEATTGYDPEYDGSFLEGFAPLFYSGMNGEMLMVNCLPIIDPKYEIPMMFRRNKGEHYQIHAEIEGIPGPVYLTDHHAGTIQDLSVQPDYPFTALSDELLERFSVRLGSVGIDDEHAVEGVKIGSGKGKLLIQGGCSGISLEVYSMLGQKISTYSRGEKFVAPMQIPLQHGHYLVKVTCGSEVKVTPVIIE
jgi:hypothetical protein